MKARRLSLLATAALALAAPAWAQVATSITPDVAAGFATGTQVSRAGAVTTIAGGVQAGGNLFHSFTTFDLAAGETARWTAANPASVSNVVNRVTGGHFSTISGLIDTTAIPGASFYFINPAGVLFTAGAQVNVPGAAYFSTAADGVRFTDGTKFSAVAPNGSAFSMTPPQSFGFLGNEGNIIIANATQSFLPNLGADLSLTAANVGIQGSVFFPHRIDLISSGGQAANISLADPLGAAPLAGQVLLTNSQILASATGAGAPAVRVSTGTFTQVGGFLTSTTSFSGDASGLTLQAQSASISGTVGSIAGQNVVQGDAGDVTLKVGTLHVTGDGDITSSTIGGGAAGTVSVTANSVLLDANGGGITSETAGANATGNAGVIQINAPTLTVANGATISSATDGLGDAGAIHIKTTTLLLDDGSIESATLSGPGHGGLVDIQAGSLTLQNKSEIGALAAATGDAGTVQITANQLSVTGASDINSSTLAAGAAGDIAINAGSLAVTDSFITSGASQSTGRAGVVTINATNLTASNATIDSDTSGSGDAGGVNINAATLSLTNNSRLSSDTFAGGRGGQVLVTAQTLTMDFSEIGSGAFEGSTGVSGDVTLNVGNLKLANQSEISSSTFGAGNAGVVSITAQQIALDNSFIDSTSTMGASGNAGQVTIHGGTVGLDNGAIVSSDTLDSGNAGGVVVTATKLSLTNGSSIESGAGAGSTGNGGAVKLTADTLDVTSTSVIITSTLSSGDAGQLIIAGGQITLDEAALESRATGAATGVAGDINITASSLKITDNGQIGTSSGNPHAAGSITIRSTGPVSLIGDRSQITSENLSTGGGAAGSISISGAPILVEDSGFISTDSTAGPAGDIHLAIPARSYLELAGATAQGVITTSSGPGTGGRITIARPLAVISNGGQILALGQQRGANVQIQSNFFIRSADRVNLLSVDGTLVLDSQVSDVSAGAAIPAVSFLDASSVLRGQCPAARSSGLTSQLSLRAFGPYVVDQAPKTTKPDKPTRLGATGPILLDHCS